MASQHKPPTVVKALLCGRAPLGDERFAGTLRGWFKT